MVRVQFGQAGMLQRAPLAHSMLLGRGGVVLLGGFFESRSAGWLLHHQRHLEAGVLDLVVEPGVHADPLVSWGCKQVSWGYKHVSWGYKQVPVLSVPCGQAAACGSLQCQSSS